MRPSDRLVAEALHTHAETLCARALALLIRRDPSVESRYADGARAWSCAMREILKHLTEAVAANRSALFALYATAPHPEFIGHELNCSDVRSAIECLREVVAEDMSHEVAGPALKLLDAVLATPVRESDAIEQTVRSRDANATLAQTYLLQLLQRDQTAAANVIFEAQRAGKFIVELYESVITPALSEVGRMWQIREASVADEHYCASVTHMIMSQLKARAQQKVSTGKRVLAVSVGDDLNDVGIRMFADYFEMNGWSSSYLGSSMPADEIIASLTNSLGSGGIDLLVVSTGLSNSVRRVADLIAAVRCHPTARLTPILVSGTPFATVNDLWEVVGADGFARNAHAALVIAARGGPSDLGRSVL